MRSDYQRRVGGDLAKTIREIRLSRGLTQVDFGKLVNITGLRISRYEVGAKTPCIEVLFGLLSLAKTASQRTAIASELEAAGFELPAIAGALNSVLTDTSIGREKEGCNV